MRYRRHVRLLAVLAAAGAMSASGLAAVTSQATSAAPDQAAARVIAAAKAQVGDRYGWGGSGPDVWDCSGLASTLWRTVGKVAGIPRVSRAQAAWATPVPASEALPGDLVFFDSPVTHVGIYLGDGRMVDASQSRRQVVLRDVYRAKVVRYGRVPRPTAPPVRGGPPPPPTEPAPPPPPPRLNPVPPLGHVSRVQAHPGAIRLVEAALTQRGAPYAASGRSGSYDSAGLVHWAWRQSNPGRPRLAVTAAQIEARTRPVAVRDVAVGDLVFYGKPAVHVGIYVGGGRMVDASRLLRRVLRRQVFASETVRFGRLLPARA
jgi:cell wall-associated NlpC family hydrolase